MASSLQDLNLAIADVTQKSADLVVATNNLVLSAQQAYDRVAASVGVPIDYSAQVQAVVDIGSNLNSVATGVAQATATVNSILP